MEYVKGDTLKKMTRQLEKGRFYSEDQVISWTLSICNVLEYLHEPAEPGSIQRLKA